MYAAFSTRDNAKEKQFVRDRRMTFFRKSRHGKRLGARGYLAPFVNVDWSVSRVDSIFRLRTPATRAHLRAAELVDVVGVRLECRYMRAREYADAIFLDKWPVPISAPP
jgi:hypothetical protein